MTTPPEWGWEKVTAEDVLKAKNIYGIRTDVAGAHTSYDHDRFMKIALALVKERNQAYSEGRAKGIEESAEVMKEAHLIFCATGRSGEPVVRHIEEILALKEK